VPSLERPKGRETMLSFLIEVAPLMVGMLYDVLGLPSPSSSPLWLMNYSILKVGDEIQCKYSVVGSSGR
jgi:xanthosine utilization system XapX-like protein